MCPSGGGNESERLSSVAYLEALDDYFRRAGWNRYLNPAAVPRGLARGFYAQPLTPNHVTLIALAIGLFSAFLLCPRGAG